MASGDQRGGQVCANAFRAKIASVELFVLDEIDHGASKIVTTGAAGGRIFGLGRKCDETAGIHHDREGVAIKRAVVGVGVDERDKPVDRVAARLLIRTRSHLGGEGRVRCDEQGSRKARCGHSCVAAARSSQPGRRINWPRTA